jgi:nucleotidyltransferase substrate binding protein (TIGR01987 family)
MEIKDIRWEQRFSNFNKALLKLNEGVEINRDTISELEKEGVIQRFEFTHELAWNVIKDYAEYQGNNSISGSRDATREGFKMNLIADGEGWMDMIISRNKTSHTYNEATMHEIYDKIIHTYYPLFIAFQEKMENLRSGEQKTLFDKE